MSTHIDTLAEWFDNGETGTFTPGDVIISKNDDEYVITTINHSGTINPGEPDRILHRAPKPKPAWHNAVAVLANHRDYEDEPRTVWTRESDPEGHDWSDAHTTMAAPHHLVNVTPLIEAKVTDEMRDRVRDYYRTEHHVELPRDDVWLNDLLTVALGLDPA